MNISSPLISVLAVTNKPKFIHRIHENYVAQKHENKELILVLNSKDFHLASVKKLFKSLSKVTIIQTHDTMALGDNLNLAIQKSQGEYLTKLDDDDFYGPFYLNNALQSIQSNDAILLGQRAFFVYLEGKQTYFLFKKKTPHRLKYLLRFSPNIIGPTLFWHHSLTEQVLFRQLPKRVDYFFVKDVLASGLPVIGTFSDQYVRNREKNKHLHVDPSSDFKKFFIPRCLGILKPISKPQFIK